MHLHLSYPITVKKRVQCNLIHFLVECSAPGTEPGTEEGGRGRAGQHCGSEGMSVHNLLSTAQRSLKWD